MISFALAVALLQGALPLPLALAQPPAPAAPPVATDVAAVAEVFGAIEVAAAAETPDEAPLAAVITRVVDRSCDAVLRESGLREWDQDDRRALSSLVAEEVEAQVRAAVAAQRPDRLTLLEDLGRRVTTRDLPAALVNRWLGFGELPAPGPRAAEAEGGPARPGLSAQLTAAQLAAADLKLVPGHARLVADLGGPGAGNGVIDAGEWVKIELAVSNASTRAWFSTSVSVASESGCLWAPSSTTELAELAPGAEAFVPAWLYLSRECTGGTRRFHVGLRDSLRSPTAEVALVGSLSPMEVPAPRLVNGRLDTDALGWSDGSQRRELAPGLRFEHSLDLLGVAEGAAVRTSYAAPQDLAGLFTDFRYRNEPLLRDSERIFRAADDLDVELVEQPAYDGILQAARQSHRWVSTHAPAKLWLGVDVALELPHPGAKGQAAPPPAITPAPPPAPLAEAAVVALVKRHLSLAPHPVEPVLPGAAAAAAGYEVVFDAKAFALAYRLELEPQQAPGAGAAGSTPPAPLPYRYRLYGPLALQTPARAAAPVAKVAPAPRLAADAPTEAQAPVAPSSKALLDLGLGLLRLNGVSGVTSTAAVTSYDLRLRLWGGAQPTYFAGVGFARDSASSYSELTAQFGLGWRGNLSDEASLTGWVSGLVVRHGNDLQPDKTGLAFEPGLTLRLAATEKVGFFLEVAGRFGPSSSVTTGSGVHAAIGLQFAL